jgi:hypothetical protein
MVLFHERPKDLLTIAIVTVLWVWGGGGGGGGDGRRCLGLVAIDRGHYFGGDFVN